jgi:hypothetical protein
MPRTAFIYSLQPSSTINVIDLPQSSDSKHGTQQVGTTAQNIVSSLYSPQHRTWLIEIQIPIHPLDFQFSHHFIGSTLHLVGRAFFPSNFGFLDATRLSHVYVAPPRGYPIFGLLSDVLGCIVLVLGVSCCYQIPLLHAFRSRVFSPIFFGRCIHRQRRRRCSSRARRRRPRSTSSLYRWV